MWLLLMFTLGSAYMHETVTVLEKYATEGECRSELKRIKAQMHDAYPNEHDYFLKCKWRAK